MINAWGWRPWFHCVGCVPSHVLFNGTVMIPALLAATVHGTIVFYERFLARKIQRNPHELQEESFVLMRRSSPAGNPCNLIPAWLTFIWIADEQAMVHISTLWKCRSLQRLACACKILIPRNPVKSGAQLFDGCSFVVWGALRREIHPRKKCCTRGRFPEVFSCLRLKVCDKLEFAFIT